MREYLSLMSVFFAAGIAIADYTEVYNNSFWLRESKTYRVYRMVYILCFFSSSRVWNSFSTTVSVVWKYPNGIYGQYSYQEKEY